MACNNTTAATKKDLADKRDEERNTVDQRVSYCSYLSVSLSKSSTELDKHSLRNSSSVSNSWNASNSLHSPNSSKVSDSLNSSSLNSSHASPISTANDTQSSKLLESESAELSPGSLVQNNSFSRISLPGIMPGPSPDSTRNCRSRPCSPPPATYLPARRPSLSLPPSPQSGRLHRPSLPFLTASFPQRLEGNGSSPANLRAPSISPLSRRRRSPRRNARTPSPRPPLPPGSVVADPIPIQPPPFQIQPGHRNRPLGQPYKSRMRSR